MQLDDLETAWLVSVGEFTETGARHHLDTMLMVARAMAAVPGLVLPPEHAPTIRGLAQLSGAEDDMARQAIEFTLQAFWMYQVTRDETPLSCAALLSRVAVSLGDTRTDAGQYAVIVRGTVLCGWFRASSELARLLEGIALLRRMWQDVEYGSVLWAAAGSELAYALMSLASEQNETWTLGQSIGLYETLLRDLPAEVATTPFHYNYGGALHTRYAASRDIVDLGRAITQYEVAIAATPPGDPWVAVRRTALAAARFERHVATDELADLDAAIRLIQTVRDPMGVKPTIDPYLLHASYLLLRFDYTRTQEALRTVDIALADVLLRSDGPDVRTLRGIRSLLVWETTNAEGDLAEAQTHLTAAFEVSRLAALCWAVVAVDELHDELHMDRPERALSALCDTNADTQPPPDAMTLIGMRLYRRHCGEPDLIHDHMRGIWNEQRSRRPVWDRATDRPGA